MSQSSDDVRKRIGRAWDKELLAEKPKRVRWWESPLIMEHVNRLTSGEPGQKEIGRGLAELVKRRVAGRVFQKGVSVGCGVGFKEMRFIRDGIVESFELFEFSEERIRKGREIARSLGVADSVNFRNEDAFEAIKESSVDFVHWNNSLHHMLDIDSALQWSRKVLKKGGLFYLDDFVGPSRFQWSDESLALATRIRSLLPEKYLRSPYNPKQFLDRIVERPDPREIAKSDPSEAAQSSLILECVRRYFPQAEITLCGGTVYHLTLTDVLFNLDEDNEYDRALLELLLLIDELTIKVSQYDNHYASALAWKD